MALKPNNGGPDGVVRIKPPPAPKASKTGPQNSEYSHPFVWTKTADEVLKKANRKKTSNADH